MSEPIAAIDIGSNAIRLVLGERNAHGDIRVFKKVREPVRLGKDVFATGEISPKALEQARVSFKKFAGLIKDHDIQYLRAVGTSALREARNREEFISTIRKCSNIPIQVISGVEEAKLIHLAVAHRVHLEDKTALLMDIGGGSVELTFSHRGKLRGTQTFKLGTVRLLQLMEERNLKEKNLKSLIQSHLEAATEFVNSQAKGKSIDVCIGTGGNFECLGKLRVALLNKSSIYSMTSEELSELVEHLQTMTVKERIQFLRLRPDRADVIVPAALVALLVMQMVPVDMLLIPYVGLRDGILAEVGNTIAANSSSKSLA